MIETVALSDIADKMGLTLDELKAWIDDAPSRTERAVRRMTGFFAHLTEEQKRAALAYDGPENSAPRQSQS